MNRSHSYSTFAVGLALVVAALVNGCSSSGDDGEKSAAVDFQGSYYPQDEGAIDGVAFGDDHRYLMMEKACRARDCTQLGSWKYDSARAELHLTDDATGVTRTIHVDVVSTRAIDVSGSLVTQSDSLIEGSPVEIGKGGQDVGKGGQDVGKGGQDVGKTGQQLLAKIVEAILDNQKMKQDDDDEGDDKPAVKEECKKVPGAGAAQADVDAYFAECPQGILTPA